MFKSLRFEHFLTLLKHAQALIGNSSAGIREAPIYGVPSIDIGDRQRGRHEGATIIQTPAAQSQIEAAILQSVHLTHAPEQGLFGDGKSADRFRTLLATDKLFSVPVDKVFVDLKEVM